MKQIKVLLMTVAIIGMTITSVAAQTVAEEKPFKTRFAVGFNFTPEWAVGNGYLGGDVFPTYGLTFETQFTKRSGLELGVFDRSYSVMWLGGPAREAREHIISTRLSYKFYSDIVNFSAGLSLDIEAGRSDNKWYGLYFSVSKDIRIYKGLIFEPSISVNPMMAKYSGRYDKGLYCDGTYLGLGLKLKYRF